MQTIDTNKLTKEQAMDWLAMESADLEKLERAHGIASKSLKRKIAGYIKQHKANVAALAAIAYPADARIDAMSDDDLARELGL